MSARDLDRLADNDEFPELISRNADAITPRNYVIPSTPTEVIYMKTTAGKVVCRCPSTGRSQDDSSNRRRGANQHHFLEGLLRRNNHKCTIYLFLTCAARVQDPRTLNPGRRMISGQSQSTIMLLRTWKQNLRIASGPILKSAGLCIHRG
ncbi:hypothetical protein BDW75DRAFT_188963 [Aspergillus navahoensis]